MVAVAVGGGGGVEAAAAGAGGRGEDGAAVAAGAEEAVTTTTVGEAAAAGVAFLRGVGHTRDVQALCVCGQVTLPIRLTSDTTSPRICDRHNQTQHRTS